MRRNWTTTHHRAFKLKILKRDQTTSPLLLNAGQQLVEYLTLYTAHSGESRESVAAALLAEPGMRVVTIKKNEDEAGKAAFPPETTTPSPPSATASATGSVPNPPAPVSAGMIPGRKRMYRRR